MQRDYEVAAMMAAALRSTLAHMKLHRPLDEVYSPFHTDASHPASRGFCDADSAAHDPRYGVSGMLAYRGGRPADQPPAPPSDALPVGRCGTAARIVVVIGRYRPPLVTLGTLTIPPAWTSSPATSSPKPTCSAPAATPPVPPSGNPE
jgi:hypothetical protein